MTYFIVTDKTGAFVWGGMARNQTDALDRAARSRRLGSYRYAVALGALGRDEWTTTAKAWTMCEIHGSINGKDVELIAGPVKSLSDIDRLQNEIPDSIYEAVDENTIYYKHIR